MTIIKFYLYEFNEIDKSYDILPLSIAYNLKPNKKYAIRYKGILAYLEIPTKTDTLTTRDICMFILGRQTICKDETLEVFCKSTIRI